MADGEVKFCSRCFRLPEDMGVASCGNHAIGCPPPTALPVEMTVEVRCVPCGFHRIIPLQAIMRNRGRAEGRCVTDNCQAKVLSQETAPLAPTAPLGAEPAPKKGTTKPASKA